jgi:hypothetical protein
MTVVSTVRSHNVPRLSKSYESFGDRFTTTVIDDIATSDLSQAVKGRVAPIYYLLLEVECILGVDAIIHVASPLSNSAAPQVILDVRGAHTWSKFSYYLSLTSRKLFSSPLSQVPPASLMPLSPLA